MVATVATIPLGHLMMTAGVAELADGAKPWRWHFPLGSPATHGMTARTWVTTTAAPTSGPCEPGERAR